MEISQKVGNLVAEIAAASNEQASGIEQVNQAVNDMDKVTQQNAANAEESASASEQMSAQAQELKNFVANLLDIVGRNSKKSNGKGFFSHKRALDRDKRAERPAGKTKEMVAYQSKEQPPHKVIPLDDADFEDF